MTFPANQVYCVFDYETYSEASLKTCGSFEYSLHPSTEVLCVAWRIGTRETLKTVETYSWSPLAPTNSLHLLLDAFAEPSIILVAQNALFEQVITKNVFAREFYTRKHLSKIPPSRFICTAALASALALPRNLEGAAKVLKLPVQKDMEGNKLVKKWCKPRKPTKNDPRTRHDDPAELDRLIKYCVTDVDTTVALFLRLPPLTPTERRVWELDQAINLRGFQVDRPLVSTILGMIAEETKELNRETEELTFGVIASAAQRDVVLAWLEGEGFYLEDLKKKTVEDALAGKITSPSARRMLEIRQAVAKTSTAKYQAFETRSRHDSRLRDILIYHAASTGRWGGAGVQPQNLARGTIKDTIQAAEILASGDLEMVRLIYGAPMNVFSSCLRGMIVAPKGRVFDVADYAAIEARVIFWVAKHEAGLEMFRAYDRDPTNRKLDPYVLEAANIFGAGTDRIDDFQRFVGKGVVLGCGYGMGPKKFAATCLTQGREVSDVLAEAAVKSYRTKNRPVVLLWSMIERAATEAVLNPGKRYTINRTTWFTQAGFLWCQLPSGRRLAYHKPRIAYEKTPWGETRPVLYHWGVDPLTRRWVEAKTYGGRLVENVVQAIARDLMAEAMLRIDATGNWDIVLSVHDELVAERKDLFAPFGGRDQATFSELMEELPDWAAGCPVKVAGWSGSRYRK